MILLKGVSAVKKCRYQTLKEYYGTRLPELLEQGPVLEEKTCACAEYATMVAYERAYAETCLSIYNVV